MADFMIVVVVLCVVGAAAAYIVKEKKRGTKCIGCPAAGQCGSCNSMGNGECSCHMDTNENGLK